MEQQRTLLLIGLFIVLFLLWDAWQQDYVRPKAPQQVTQSPVKTGDSTATGADIPVAADLPATDTAVPTAEQNQVPKGKRIRVTTDVLELEIDSLGGDLRKAALLKYPKEAGRPEQPLVLMNDEQPYFFVAQTGFAGKRADRQADLVKAPNHHTVYQTQAQEYVLVGGQDELIVPLTWTSQEGVVFTKTYRLKRGSYLIEVEHQIENQAKQVWHGNLYQQLQRSPLPESDQQSFIYTYTGGVIYSEEEKYEKISFDDMQDENLSRDIEGGWGAMIQHYFLGVWIPDPDETFRYYSRAFDNNRYALGMTSRSYEVGPGEKQVLKNQLFVGPKLQDTLEKIAPGLELTVDYGFLTVIAKPIFWLLEWIHSVVKNWGWSIIILTIIIKLAFYKLSETSYKSMANMRRMQPRMMALKERYGDDKQKMNQALMELYKKEKINPLGGCFPILIQIPVFIALYWVLLESVEMRQAPWIGWIQDMSSADPYFILPVIMGVTMLIQQKLNPTPLDPIQAKLMMILPIVFTVFFAFFPAGLVLYWVVNNVLSIAQQWYITRVVIGVEK